MANKLKGQVGFTSDFEPKTGRYIVDFKEGVGQRKQFALHPVNLQPVDSETAACGKKKKTKKARAAAAAGGTTKKDEL